MTYEHYDNYRFNNSPDLDNCSFRSTNSFNKKTYKMQT